MLQDSARISAFALKADSKLTSGPTNRRVSDCKEIGNHVPSMSGSLLHSACKNFHGLKWINYFFNWSFFLVHNAWISQRQHKRVEDNHAGRLRKLIIIAWNCHCYQLRYEELTFGSNWVWVCWYSTGSSNFVPCHWICRYLAQFVIFQVKYPPKTPPLVWQSRSMERRMDRKWHFRHWTS